MEKSMINRCQIRSIGWDHKISHAAIKPLSCLGGCGWGYGYGANYNFKGRSNVHLYSAFKPPLFTALSAGDTLNKRGQLWVHRVGATSSSDHKGGEGVPDKSKSTVVDVFAGIIGYLIRLSKRILGILSNEKKAFKKFEDKIENAVEVVEETAETVKEIAQLTEEIAEKVEGQSTEGGIFHKSAEIVDNISERIAKDAEIVDNEMEKIKKSIKAIDEKVEGAEDGVEDISEAIFKDHKGIDVAENSRVEDNQSVDSVDVISKSKVGEIIEFKDIIETLILWGRELSSINNRIDMRVIVKILVASIAVIVFGTQVIAHGFSNVMMINFR